MRKLAALKAIVLSGFVLLLAAGAARATDLSGSYASTQTITTDSQLTGDVTCTLTSGPCIRFGADNLHLSLNGHTITGSNASLSPCTSGTGVAISTNGKMGAHIEGPGLITNFNGDGIKITGSNSEVRDVAITEVCNNGIKVRGSDNDVHDNSVSRFSLSGSAFNGISVLGDGGHQIHQNEITGGGAIVRANLFSGTGFGIFVSSTNGNVIEQNDLSGNSLGIWVSSTGNTVQRNQILGNVPFNDIFDANAPGSNAYDDNLCQTSAGTGAPTCPNLPPDVKGYR